MTGSSPRVWGQVRVQFNTFRVLGIIPTRMGTSFIRSKTARFVQDHPHAYGDKLAEYIRKIRVQGSSPRVWGQVEQGHISLPRTGIIPTRMGTRRCRNICGHYAKDHPHAYGDKSFATFNDSGFTGSSPRVWGQANGAFHYRGGVRIIPTRMGTSGF